MFKLFLKFEIMQNFQYMQKAIYSFSIKLRNKFINNLWLEITT